MLDFTSWWNDFLEEQRLLKDLYLSVSNLTIQFNQLSEAEQERVRYGLMEVAMQQQTGFRIAMAYLKKERTIPDFKLAEEFISRRMNEAGRNHEEQQLLADWVYLLAIHRQEHPLVREYLLERKTDSYWTSVPWALWPGNRELFVRSWVRYFMQAEPSEWKDSKLMNPFAENTEAAELVLQQLRRFQPDVWKDVKF